MIPSHVTEEIDKTLWRLPADLRDAAGNPDWTAIYRAAGLLDLDDLKNALLTTLILDVEVAVAFHVALLSNLLGDGFDKRHLPILEVPPTSEAAWMQADLGCERCPGSVSFTRTTTLVTELQCGCDDRTVRWSNCLIYRENAKKEQP